jgi:FtsP/CotA-like multicopper oxidase with cupredoxin domain
VITAGRKDGTTMRTPRRLPKLLPALVLVVAGAVALGPTSTAAPAPTSAPFAHAAVPQGPLPQTGCARSGATATCDLYAKSGTLAVASLPVPIWGLASADTAAATTPGPVLVVTQGDAVTVTVHNGLQQALALAVPGMTGLADDTTGVAPGSVGAYTFTASRPGTFLYEAGHTPDGARQTAMGVVGALVVRPAGGGLTAYGAGSGAFDDEAVLVLSEIDPAFNANPTGFDLRSFRPTYRLINGRAYPETDPVATAPGRKVLLRYVNAGLLGHPMGVLGTTQTVLGQDARPVENPYALVSDQLAAGGTEDALVVVPPGEDGMRFPVYETSGRLDTAGHLAGTTKTVAFGGMLTFLDTGATPQTGDVAGPVTQRLTLAPVSATALQTVTVIGDFTDTPNGGSAVTKAEYVIDDPTIAVGSGTAFTGSFGSPTVTGATATIPLSTLTPSLEEGRHTVYVRALDAQGNWGFVDSVILTVSSSGPRTTGVVLNPATTNGTTDLTVTATGDDSALGGVVDRAELFLGSQDANGSGTAMVLNPAKVVAETGTVPVARLASIPEGVTSVLVHSHDSFGLWGPTQTLPLRVDRTPPTLVTGAAEPSPNNGTAGSPVDPNAMKVTGTFTDPTSASINSPVTAAEGFLDNASGTAGTGLTFVAADGKFDNTTETAYGLVPLTEFTRLAEGTHSLYVHAKDLAGNWGPLAPVSFVVDRGGPTVSATSATPDTIVRATLVFSLSATANDAFAAIAAGEWFEGADPGKGLGKPMTVTGTGPTSATLWATGNPGGLSAGQHTLLIRAKDSTGNWGATTPVVITVSQLSNTVFADGFESGGTGAWTGQVGSVAVNAAGALGGAFGLQATGSGGLGAYVLDATPLNESGYHAQFQFSPGNLSTGNGTVTLLQGRSTTNATQFAVQYRKQGAGAAQVRLGVLRANGVTSYTNWITLGAGTQTIRVDWAAGGSSTQKLTVGSAVQQLTGIANTAARIDAVWLGLSAGGGATSGTAAFDSFSSTRFTLP